MKALAALVELVIGTVVLAVGVALLGWALLRAISVEKAFDAAMWVAAHAPAAMELTPVTFANGVINNQFPWMIGAFGLMALMVASSIFRSSRRAAGVSEDGKARLELAGGERRVGKPLEGQVVLARSDLVGKPFDIRIQCLRRSGKYGKFYRTDYADSIQVTAVPGAQGARLPFRFDIPLTAPPSRAFKPLTLQDPREWQLAIGRPKAWTYSWFFPLQVSPGPAEMVAEAVAAMPPPVQGPFPWKFAGMWFAGAFVLFLVIDAVISFARAP